MTLESLKEEPYNGSTKIIYSAFINDLYNLSYEGYASSQENKRLFQTDYSKKRKTKTPKSLFLFLDFMLIQMATCSKEELTHTQTFLIKDYQLFRKLKNSKTARKEMKFALSFLHSCSFDHDGKEEKILNFDTKQRNQIKVCFSSAFFNEQTRIAKYPLVLAQIGLNRLETDMGRYLVDQYSSYHQKKFLKITTLLKHATSLPSYEEIKNKGQINQRIKSPLLTAIKSLESIGIITNYNFVNKQKTSISEEDFLKLNACEFERLLLQFELATKFAPERRPCMKTKKENILNSKRSKQNA